MSIQHIQLDILNSASRIRQILGDPGAVSWVGEKARQKFSSCPYLKTFVSPFLPTWLTAPGSPRMNHCINADRTTWKLTLQDINTTPKEPKTEQDHTHRQLFRYYCSSSVWHNNQRKLWWKISAHSDLKEQYPVTAHAPNFVPKSKDARRVREPWKICLHRAWPSSILH